MRILVLSDSHGRVGPMEEAVEAVRPQPSPRWKIR